MSSREGGLTLNSVKGAWLQRSFTLSTTCHAVALREGGSTIYFPKSGFSPEEFFNNLSAHAEEIQITRCSRAD